MDKRLRKLAKELKELAAADEDHRAAGELLARFVTGRRRKGAAGERETDAFLAAAGVSDEWASAATNVWAADLAPATVAALGGLYAASTFTMDAHVFLRHRALMEEQGDGDRCYLDEGVVVEDGGEEWATHQCRRFRVRLGEASEALCRATPKGRTVEEEHGELAGRAVMAHHEELERERGRVKGGPGP